MARWTTTAVCVLSAIVSAPAVHAQIQGGGLNQYPKSDDESRLIRSDPPTPVKITRGTARGEIIARGSWRIDDVNRLAVPGECVFDFGIEIEMYSGSREVTLQPQADCTVVVADVEDYNVVEAEEYAKVAGRPGVFGALRRVAGNLWQALFPTAFAQGYFLKTLYHHIYSCGAACAGGIDGLTAQQGWLEYRFNGIEAKLDAAWAWFCMAGSQGGGYSWCQYPMHIVGAPMAPVNTGWTGYGTIMYRHWGPGTQVSAGDQSTYQWYPIGIPYPTYIHTLHNERKANSNGSVSCISWVSGSIPNGPVKSGCRPENR